MCCSGTIFLVEMEIKKHRGSAEEIQQKLNRLTQVKTYSLTN